MAGIAFVLTSEDIKAAIFESLKYFPDVRNLKLSLIGEHVTCRSKERCISCPSHWFWYKLNLLDFTKCFQSVA